MLLEREKGLKYCGIAVIAALVCGLLYMATLLKMDPKLRRQALIDREIAKDQAKAEFSLAKIAMLADGGIARRFIQNIHLPLAPEDQPLSVVYGHPEIGFFESRMFTPEGFDLNLEFIPPTYRMALNFCIRQVKGDLEYITSKKFEAPRSPIIEQIKVEIEGRINQPFILLAGIYVPDPLYSDTDSSYLPIIINRLGEIVWAHLPQNGRRSFKKYPVIKKIREGEYGILFGESASFFERFNYRGEVLESLDPKKALDPYIIHHDFLYKAKGKLITLGHKIYYTRNILPFLEKVFSPFGLLAQPTSMVSTTVEEVDIESNTNKVLWDPIDYFNYNDLSWARDLEDAKISVEGPADQFGRFKEKVNVDFSHANSIECYEGRGCLVSLRNLSKLIFLDPTMKKVLWTMGNEADDTFQTLDERHAFYHQHHAQILPSGHILMMDNHTSPPAEKNVGARVAVYGLDPLTKKTSIIWNFYPSEGIQLKNRGSVFLLANKNVLAFYPASRDAIDHLFEVDYKTGLPVGHAKVYFSDIKPRFSEKQLRLLEAQGKEPDINRRLGGGNRATPIEQLGMEQPLMTNQACVPSQTISQ